MRLNWRAGRIGRLLRIHSPGAHLLNRCWCRGTRWEIFPEMYTAQVAIHDIEVAAAFLNELSERLEDQSKEL